MQSTEPYLYLGIDIGAGLGAKMALFRDFDLPVSERLLPISEYGETFDAFALALIRRIESLLDENEVRPGVLRSIGVVCPGILRADGSFLLVANLPHLNGRNLAGTLEDYFKVPVAIDNDANAGGLAEWSVLRYEILYWVFGGGWGGAWISREGEVRFPALDWDGRDESLHPTNEPGYSIGLDRPTLKTLFGEVSASFERFERIVVEELNPAGGALGGPGGSRETIRAEVILSGPGRLRLFRTLAGDDELSERFPDTGTSAAWHDPGAAGGLISKLSSMRIEAAVNTDRLYGKVLAMATRAMLRAAAKDGLPDDVPICLGGKPAYALPYFGPSAQRAMGRLGILSYLRPSVIDERGSNANLVGAGVLAQKAWEKAGRSRGTTRSRRARLAEPESRL